MLNSFSNSVKFPSHLVLKQDKKKKSTQIFANSISSRSADDFNKCRCSRTMSPAPLENIQTPQFCPVCILMICGGTVSQECDCVHLCQHIQPGLRPNQLWAEPEVGSAIMNQGSLNLLIHPPPVYLSCYPSFHPLPHSFYCWLLSLSSTSL